MKIESEQKKEEYLSGQAEGAADHRVTFCLSPAVRDALALA